MTVDELHQQLQVYANEHPATAGGVLTRWVVLAEVQLPGGEALTTNVSCGPAGVALRSWEAEGLLVASLMDRVASRVSAHRHGR